MIYKINRNYCNENIENSNLIFNSDALNELDVNLGGDDKDNRIIINLKFNGIRERVKHGPRLKITKVPGDKGHTYTYPLNPNNGVITYCRKYNPNQKIGRKLSKIIAGFAHENYDIIKKFFGYRDEHGNIINGDPSMEEKIINAANKYNSLSNIEKKLYSNKGIIQYEK